MTPPTTPDLTTTGRCRIAPSSAVAFRLAAGERLRVTDPEGEQVSDLMAFADGDPDHWLSSGRTFDYQEMAWLTTGHRLWSTDSASPWCGMW